MMVKRDMILSSRLVKAEAVFGTVEKALGAFEE
jgi:hypothetical protein